MPLDRTTGYPLPTLLRLAILDKVHLGEPLDAILSYGSHTIRSIEPNQSLSNLERYLPHFTSRASVPHVMAASPLDMGLLANPPAWHPAPQSLKDDLAGLKTRFDLPSIAMRYASRPLLEFDASVQVVVGWTSPQEVAASLSAYTRSVERREEDLEEEQAVLQEMQSFGHYPGGWTWESGRQSS
jgi:D-arabinose 1-dehydrogenase